MAAKIIDDMITMDLSMETPNLLYKLIIVYAASCLPLDNGSFPLACKDMMR